MRQMLRQPASLSFYSAIWAVEASCSTRPFTTASWLRSAMFPIFLAVALVAMAQSVERTTRGAQACGGGLSRHDEDRFGRPIAYGTIYSLTNKNSIRPLLEELRGVLAEMESGLMHDELQTAFDEAARTRRESDGNKGLYHRMNIF